jgi:hypothetical protein
LGNGSEYSLKNILYVYQNNYMENNTTNNTSSNQFKGIVSILVLVGLAWFFFGGGKERMVQSEMEKIQEQVPAQMQQIENQVADDAVKQYGIAERAGDKMQMYTQASLCAASFLQAKDEANYRKWLDIQHKLAKQIGMPE